MGIKIRLLMVSLLAVTLLAGTAMAEQWQTIHVTSNSVWDGKPDITADGKKVVFLQSVDMSDISGQGMKYIILADLDTSQSSIVPMTIPMYGKGPATHNSAMLHAVSITADGSKIALTTVIMQSTARYHLYTEDIASTNMITYELEIAPPAMISGDGSKILFVWINPSNGAGVPNQQYVATFDANDATFYKTDGEKTLGPIGKMAGYKKYAEQGALFATISTDASKIAYVTGTASGQNFDLYVVNVDGTGVYKIASGPIMYRPSLSADGSKIAFIGDDQCPYIASTFAVQPKRLSDHIAKYITISGDGKKVAFSLPETGETYAVSADGSGLSKISNGPLVDLKFNYDGTNLVGTRDNEIVLSSPGGSSPLSQLQGTSIHASSIPSTLVFHSAKATSGMVYVPITTNTSKVIGSMNLVLKYNTSLLTAKNVTAGSLNKGALIDFKISGDTINVGIADPKGFTGSGSIAMVGFEVRDQSKPGSSLPSRSTGQQILTGSSMLLGRSLSTSLTNVNENLVIYSVSSTGVNGGALPFWTVNGTFTADYIKGDVNRNGKIESVDALMAIQMSVGKLPVDLIADMNGDKKVDASDAMEILKQVTQSITWSRQGTMVENNVISAITGGKI